MLVWSILCRNRFTVFESFASHDVSSFVLFNQFTYKRHLQLIVGLILRYIYTGVIWIYLALRWDFHERKSSHISLSRRLGSSHCNIVEWNSQNIFDSPMLCLPVVHYYRSIVWMKNPTLSDSRSYTDTMDRSGVGLLKTAAYCMACLDVTNNHRHDCRYTVLHIQNHSLFWNLIETFIKNSEHYNSVWSSIQIFSLGLYWNDSFWRYNNY